MTAMPLSFAPASFTPSPHSGTWCFVLLEHLDEFAKLAWYLVADGKLVEDTFTRTMAKLDRIPFGSVPAAAYRQARDVLITQAIAVVSNVRREDTESSFFQAGCLGGLPDLPRLAFILRLIVRSSEAEVAEFLGVSPSEVQGLVTYAIDRLSVVPPISASTGCHDA